MIAAERLGEDSVALCRDALANAGLSPGVPAWVEAGCAFDISFAQNGAVARALLEPVVESLSADVVVQAERGRAKRLLVADMDSTVITVECIDELADYAGVKPEVAAITERAMRGELDFAGALAARVALLRGLEVDVLARCLSERVVMMPGAAELVGTMRAHGATTLLVSGGFTAFAQPVADLLGFQEVVANVLGVESGRLTGTVAEPIVDAARKGAALTGTRKRLRLAKEDVLAVGDGANDLPMVQMAGLGVAYRAKPVLRSGADASIVKSDLTGLLYAQGYAKRDWRVSGSASAC